MLCSFFLSFIHSFFRLVWFSLIRAFRIVRIVFLLISLCVRVFASCSSSASSILPFFSKLTHKYAYPHIGSLARTHTHAHGQRHTRSLTVRCRTKITSKKRIWAENSLSNGKVCRCEYCVTLAFILFYFISFYFAKECHTFLRRIHTIVFVLVLVLMHTLLNNFW